MPDTTLPRVTVAAVVQQDGRFLLVEENTPEGLRLNNPAGHLEAGESLLQAVVRETLEETAYDFTPTALLGVYLNAGMRAHKPVSYVRFAFTGELGRLHAERALDQGIVRTVWLTPEQIAASAAQHRSPAVMQAVRDAMRGVRYPLDVLRGAARGALAEL